jgi:hypothetical protein
MNIRCHLARLGSSALALALLAALATLAAPRAAHAVDAADPASSFRMTLAPPGAQVCVVFPDAQRDPVSCPDLPPSITEGTGAARHLLITEVRFPDWHMLVQVNTMREERSQEFTEAGATSLVSGVRRGMREAGAQLTPTSPEGQHETLRINGLQVIRHTVDVSSFGARAAAGLNRMFAYHIVGEGSIVTVMASVSDADAARAAPVVESMVRTVRMNPARRADTLAYRIGYMMGPVLLIALIAWLASRRKRAATPPQPPQPPYPPQQPPYPPQFG